MLSNRSCRSATVEAAQRTTGQSAIDWGCGFPPSQSPLLTAAKLLAKLKAAQYPNGFRHGLGLTILAAIRFCGLLLIAALYLNDLRLVLNSVAPGAQMSMPPARPQWTLETTAIVSLASLEALLLAVVSMTIGRVMKLNHAEGGTSAAHRLRSGRTALPQGYDRRSNCMWNDRERSYRRSIPKGPIDSETVTPSARRFAFSLTDIAMLPHS